MKKMKAKARLTQALSLTMLGGVMSPYAVMASDGENPVVEERIDNSNGVLEDETEDKVLEFSSEVHISPMDSDASSDLSKSDNEKSENEENSDDKKKGGASQDDNDLDKDKKSDESNKNKESDEDKKISDVPEYEIDHTESIKKDYKIGEKIDLDDILDEEKLVLTVKDGEEDSEGKNIDILEYLKDEDKKEELESKGFEISREVYQGDNLLEDTEVEIKEDVEYTIMYTIKLDDDMDEFVETVLNISAKQSHKVVLDVKDTISININEDIPKNWSDLIINKAEIDGEDASSRLEFKTDLPNDKKDLNKNKTYEVETILKYEEDGESKQIKKVTQVKVIDHGIVLRVEPRIDWEFGKKITTKDLEGFIREAKINGKDVTKDVLIEHNINIVEDGEYDITYTLKDKNGNEVVETTRVYVESDIDFRVPSKITIEKSDKKFDPKLDDVVAKKGERSYINKLRITHNVVPSKIGTYHINYTLEIGEYKETKTTVVEVIESPEFIVPEEIIVVKGRRFLPTKEGIVAKINGKDYTDKVEFEYDVDAYKTGEYELKYILKHNGDVYERTSKVLVVDGVDLEVHEKAAIELGKEFDPMSFVKKATVGDVNAIDRVTATHEVDTETPGKYEVLYTMDLGNGRSLKETMELTVLEEGVLVEEDDGSHTKPDGDNYEYEYEYEYDEDEVINEVVKTGEVSSGFEALRTALVATPILGMTMRKRRIKK